MIPLRDENPTNTTPWVTFLIIAACIFIFVVPQGATTDADQARDFNLAYAAIPCELTSGEPLSVAEIVATFDRGEANACADDGTDSSLYPGKIVYLGAIASMFLHGGIMHLVGNMWSLWIFGNNIEDRLGHLRYLLVYLVGGLAATAAHVAVGPNSTIPVVGASGAIAAIMGAYVVWWPDAPIRTIVFFTLRDIRARWFLGIWFFSQFLTAADSSVAWVAHVGGFVFGVLVGLFVRMTDFGNDRINPSDDVLVWDSTGGAGRGPLPHPFESRRSPR